MSLSPTRKDIGISALYVCAEALPAATVRAATAIIHFIVEVFIVVSFRRAALFLGSRLRADIKQPLRQTVKYCAYSDSASP